MSKTLTPDQILRNSPAASENSPRINEASEIDRRAREGCTCPMRETTHRPGCPALLSSDPDDAPPVTEESFGHPGGHWRIGGKIVTEEEGKAAARAQLTSKPLDILRSGLADQHEINWAADEIERLTRELAAVVIANKGVADLNCDLSAERDRLRAALQKIVAWTKEYDPAGVRGTALEALRKTTESQLGCTADEPKAVHMPPEAMCLGKCPPEYDDPDGCPWSGDWRETLCPVCKGPVGPAAGDPGTRPASKSGEAK